MSKRISEHLNCLVGLVPQTISNTNVTGKYFPVAGLRRLLAIAQIGAVADTKIVTVEFLQATSAAGAGAKGIPTTATQAATCTFTAPTKMTECTLTLLNVANADIIIINGITFTGQTDTTTAASREFAVNGNDTADALALSGLINNATYGVPGVTSTPNGAVLTLTSTVPGATLITVASAAATITPACTKAQSYVEIDAADLAAGFTHVAVKVTSTAAGIVGVTLLTEGRNSPSQKVGASALK